MNQLINFLGHAFGVEAPFIAGHCPAGNGFVILGREKGKEKKIPVGWEVKREKEKKIPLFGK